ncbi:hypothetical protein [Provencibacterium massiliense]|uniref:hypothetical protein n=1 Tax=Provencibacterium massiliense TaxID=1841868 RepID=UPI0009A82A83|nr:hypothetical protein [Provencibacterium massiliense]RGB70013.1 hypothetical protein DW086_02490 [Harryflintia acetispora]
MKVLLILDGLCDVPAPQLGYKTPLQVAGSATLRDMRAHGAHGFFDTCPPGREPDSMGCILTLLGVEAQRIPDGRACLEAMALGLPVREGDLWLRVSLAAVSASGELLSAVGAGLDSDGLSEAARLLRALEAGGCSYFPAGDYRGLVCLPGRAGWMGRLSLPPPHQNLGKPLAALLPRGGEEAALLRGLIRKSGELLAPLAREDRRYLLLPWGGAMKGRLPAFMELHGLRAGGVCAAGIVRGICAAMEIDCPSLPGATADWDTDLAGKLRAARNMWDHDFLLLHLNGADECAHRRDPVGKARFLSRVERELLAPLYAALGAEDSLLVCGDHGTNSQTGRHERGAQPFWLRSPHRRGDLGTLPGTAAVGLLRGETLPPASIAHDETSREE